MTDARLASRPRVEPVAVACLALASSASAQPIPAGHVEYQAVMCHVGPEGRFTRSLVTLSHSLPDERPALVGPAASAPDNRVDVVIVGDGYTAEEMGRFRLHADRAATGMLSREPLTTYAPYFRFTPVEVVSAESGVDNDPTRGVRRDTAMHVQYWCNDIERLLCVDVGRALSFARAAVPDVDQVLAIANSSKYGGAGYSGADVLTAAGDNTSVVDVVIHELGHSLANLADEYDYGGPPLYTGGERSEANVSIFSIDQQIAAQSKWWRWNGDSRPGYDGPVGSFEGARYSVEGLFRPTRNSLMRSLGRPFSVVNAESMIANIYREVDPIDAVSHDEGVVPLGDTIEVTPMQPVGRSLSIEWAINGSARPELDGRTLVEPSSLGLLPGDTVAVTVRDDTDLVRDPAIRDTLLTSTRLWTLESSASGRCSVADLARTGGQYGTLDGNDIAAFVDAFLDASPVADLVPLTGIIDGRDIGTFVDAFLAGCP